MFEPFDPRHNHHYDPELHDYDYMYPNGYDPPEFSWTVFASVIAFILGLAGLALWLGPLDHSLKKPQKIEQHR